MRISANCYDGDFHKGMFDLYMKRSRWTKLRLRQAERLVNPKPGEKILDLGCSSGAISHFCTTFGAAVVGVDSSAAATEMARQLFRVPLISFETQDVSDLTFIDASFNKAVAFDLIEHLTEEVFRKMLKETYRVLKSEGTLSLYTPCPTHITERLKARNLVLKQNPTHIALRSMEEIVPTLEEFGFKVDMAYHTVSFIPIVNMLERIGQHVPGFKNLCHYRICVRGMKN